MNYSLASPQTVWKTVKNLDEISTYRHYRTSSQSAVPIPVATAGNVLEEENVINKQRHTTMRMRAQAFS